MTARRTTVFEEAVARLAELVSDGGMRVGSRLDERRLVITLRVSRATVRSALQFLGTHGAVDVVPGKGAFIRDVSPREAEDLFDLRARVEPLLVSRFAERASTGEFAAFAEAVRAFVSAARCPEPDLTRVRRANDRMYEVLLSAPVGWALTKAVRTERLRLRIFSRRRQSPHAQLERYVLSASMIERLLPCIAQRDAEATRRFCERAMLEDRAAAARSLQRGVPARRAA